MPSERERESAGGIYVAWGTISFLIGKMKKGNEGRNGTEGTNVALFDSLRFHSLMIRDRSSFTKAMLVTDKYKTAGLCA